jgi:hypothetical protein
MIVVEGPPDELGDVSERRDERFGRGKTRVHPAELPLAFDVDAIGPVDHDFAHTGIVQVAEYRFEE